MNRVVRFIDYRDFDQQRMTISQLAVYIETPY